MMMSTKMLVLKTSLVVGVDALKPVVAQRNYAVPSRSNVAGGAAMDSLAHLEKHMAPNPKPVIPVSDPGDDWINSADDFELQWALQESASQAEQRGKQIPNLPDDEFQRMPVQNNNDAVRAVKNLVDQGYSELDAITHIANGLGKNPDELQLDYVLDVSKVDEQRIREAKDRVLECVNDHDNLFATCVMEIEYDLKLPDGIFCELYPDLALQLALKQAHGKNMDADQEYVEDVADRFGLKDSDLKEFLQLQKLGVHQL